MRTSTPTPVFSINRAPLHKLAFLGAGLGAGFALAVATVSFAQSYDPEYGTGNVGVAYMVQPDGSTMRVGGKTGTINDAGHAMAMQYGAELPAGSVLYRRGNKLYAVKDQMVGDQMMSARAKEWVN